MALNAATGALGHLVFGQGGEEARRRPALLVGASGELGPDGFDGGQSQVVESQGKATGVDGVGGVHAAISVLKFVSSL